MSKDRYRFYRIEARELLDGLSQGVLALEKSPADGEIVKRLLRFAHTLKGASRVVDLAVAADRSHALEDALAPHRDGAPVPATTITELLAIVDALEAAVATITTVSTAAARPTTTGPTTAMPSATMQGPGASATVPTMLADQPIDAVRVPIETLDRLLETIAELGVQLRGIGSVESTRADRARVELAEVRKLAGELRLTPIAGVFDGLERTTRDAALHAGKQVELVAAGGDQRVDGAVLAPLRTALLHAIRNAVDHGIELPADRARTGKPTIGRIEVSAIRRGARIAVSVRDDGRGIDVGAVRAAAVRAGKLAASATLDADGAAGLLMAGGISTARSVTALSGRGVGLDAVRAAIAQIGGSTSLRSTPDGGTELELVVPVSLASRVVLRVVAGGIVCCIPLDAVRRVVRLDDTDRVLRDRDGDTMLDPERPRTLAVRELGLLFARHRAYRPTPVRASLVIVEAGGRALALSVDRVLGVEDVVASALPALVGRMPAIEGCTLDVDGTPQPVLEPVNLLAALASSPAAIADVVEVRALPILVIDDSLTTRMLEKNILELAGYDVELAISGEEALTKVRARRFGLFVCDVEMPGMDGFELLARFRDDASTRDIPAILVTSLGSADHRRRGSELGVRAYIVKSEFDQARFLGAIRDVVGAAS